jgi:hypothetical protein
LGHEYFSSYSIAIETGSAGQGTDRGAAKRIDQTVRHRAHEDRDALIPDFISQIPHDIIGGIPLHYRRTNDEKFLLYSIGWNETDDSGQIGLRDSGSVEISKGDWVWLNL